MKKMKKRQILALLITAIMVMGILAACGNSTTDSPQGNNDADSQQILRFGTTGIEGRFLSITANNLYDSYVNQLVFEPLVSPNAEGIYGPEIADFVISTDNLTYTFTLRDGITFSDGTAMTSADVAFTYRSIAHPDYDGPRSYVVSDLTGYEDYRAGVTTDFPGIEIIDERTIAFHYAPGNASPANIGNFFPGIMPEHIFAFDNWIELVDQNSSPVGSGKFILDEYRPMEFVRLSTNRNYWNSAETPIIDGILMMEVPEDSLQNAFLTGQIDIAQPETSIDNYNAYNEMSGVTTLTVLGNSYQFLAFNTLRPQLSDVRVRQALMYALDRQAYIDIMFGALGSVGLAPISPASWAFPTTGMNDYALDMEMAAQLMADAGWVRGSDGILEKDGIRMELSWLVYTETAWPGIISELAFDSWREIGVDLTIELMDFNTVGARTFDAEPGQKDYDIFTMGFSLSVDPDPSGGLFDYNAFEACGFHTAGYNNETAQRLIIEGRTEFDQAKRTEIYHEWARLMNYEIPKIIVAYRNEIWVIADHVQGLEVGTYWEWHRSLSSVTLG